MLICCAVDDDKVVSSWGYDDSQTVWRLWYDVHVVMYSSFTQCVTTDVNDVYSEAAFAMWVFLKSFSKTNEIFDLQDLTYMIMIGIYKYGLSFDPILVNQESFIDEITQVFVIDEITAGATSFQ